jgi:HlyD family secretion protein
VKRILWIAGVAALTLAGCSKPAPAPVYLKVPVERRDIVVAAAAAGPIQPILTVAVKSQASGAVTEMHVQTGDDVRPGQLLALIDPRLPKSALDQAQAAVDQAQAQFDYAQAQLAREDTLYKVQAVTQQDFQNTRVSFEQAKAGLITAKANLDDAKIAFDQTRVTAALGGTIIEKDVDIGTVISSPTHDVTGGTQMFKMANLDTVQVQAMVDETDVGKVSAGLPVTITVDAYPNRPFQGSVLKVEPQATVNQNVTQFPVDINILNPGHILKPGMNTEVQIHVGERQGIIAIPNAALRTQRDVASAATVLGLNVQDVMAQLAAQQAAPAPKKSGDTAASMGGAPGGKPDTTQANTMTLPNGRVINLPKGVTGTQVQAIFAKRMSGGTLSPSEQAIMTQLRSQFGRPGGNGGQGGGRVGGPVAMQNTSYIVFVLRNGKPTPVAIKTGLTDLDYTEVTFGLADNDTVLVLPSASLVQSQQDFKNRFQNLTGGGLPGLRQQSGGTAARP